MTTLELLLRQFNGAHIAKIHQAGLAIGLKKQSTYNSLQKKTFPLPVVNVEGRRGVRVADIAAFIDGLTPFQKPIKAKRGRPTRKEQAAKLRVAQTETGGA